MFSPAPVSLSVNFKVLVSTIDRCAGMLLSRVITVHRDWMEGVGLARYEPAPLPP